MRNKEVQRALKGQSWSRATRRMSQLAKRIRSEFINTMTRLGRVPGECCLCYNTLDREDHWICSHCLPYLPYCQTSSSPHVPCITCGTPLPTSTSHQRCGQCLKCPPAIDRLRTCFYYQYPINDWLPRLKFGKEFAVADWFAQHWWRYWTQGIHHDALQHVTPPFQVIPVPLHNQRLRQRGYNQSLLIARRLAKRLGLPLNTHCVKRLKKTQAQSGLSLKQRQRNIKQAFAVTEPPPLKIILVDDVITTGSTINELAKTLKSKGAIYIEAWVMALAPSNSGKARTEALHR